MSVSLRPVEKTMMIRSRLIFMLLVLLLITRPALAGLKDIRTDKLPQDESIQKAYTEAVSVEEFSRDWSDSWHYDTPKDAVASALKDSLEKLQQALVSAPDNSELLLLTGLVGHYAYNVDVQGAYEVAVSSLQKALKLEPDNARAEWFLGTHECQAGKVKEGMDKLLAIENRSAWDHLSPGYWDDYMSCATLANMPAHVLRAGDYFSKLNAPSSQSRTFLIDIAKKRFRPPDLSATYSGKEVWEAENEDSRLIFTNYMCGFSFSPRAEWKLARLEVQQGLCVAQIETGPHPSKAGDVIPTLLVIARQPKPGESLSDFMKRFMKYPSTLNLQGSRCPSEKCLAFEAVVPNAYGKAGNGHPLVTVFQRDPPEFPGLLLERPHGPEAPKDEKVAYFHPQERFHRMEGILYYLVMLDTADAVLDDAKQDYDTFLKSLQVE